MTCYSVKAGLNYLQKKLQQNQKLISLGKDGSIFLDELPLYVPFETASKFHNDNTSEVKVIMGAIRSGKSSASCAEIIRRAIMMQPCKDGIRRIRVGVVRTTYPELKTTTLQTWLKWWHGLGEVRIKYDSPISVRHVFYDKKGRIELDVWFFPLETAEDADKLLSLELTIVYVNELRELVGSLLSDIRGRVGQYPSADLLESGEITYWSGIIADTNPPDIDHWFYKMFEIEKIPIYKLYRQPSPLIYDLENKKWIENPKGENIKNLKKNYYQNLMIGTSKEYQKVYVLGEYGYVYDGRVVYPSYNDDLHSIDSPKLPIPKEILLGWDFGLTPACIVCILDGAKLYVIKEFTTERMYPEELIDIVVDWLSINYPAVKIISECDPSGSEIHLAHLSKRGIPTAKANTNDIDPRISSVNYFLNRLDMGTPAFILNRIGCPDLRKGFLGKYCFERIKVIGDEKYKDMPKKNHPFSDIQDSLQYVCLRIMARLGCSSNRNKVILKTIEYEKNMSNLKKAAYYGNR